MKDRKTEAKRIKEISKSLLGCSRFLILKMHSGGNMSVDVSHQESLALIYNALILSEPLREMARQALKDYEEKASEEE
jgi:hypothetical protein